MNSIDVDRDLQAMKRAGRRPLLVGLGVTGGIVALAGLYVLMGASAVKSSLVSDGYQDVQVHMNGPFEYGFTATKNNATCGGTVTRTPVTTSREQTCFSSK